MTRDKRTIKFTKPVKADKLGMQLATPEIVAGYIAERLKTGTIADLGCGIGGQVIFFARTCRKVYAVDIDGKKIEYVRYNCRLYGVKNVVFIHGDALSPEVKKQVEDADIIFSDPARPLSEKERTFDTLQPPIPKIIEFYRDMTEDMAFHAPPQMPPERIGYNCEKEYLSLNGQLNRLTLYFGKLKQCDRSAHVLPAGAHLQSKDPPPINESEVQRYAYEPEPSVVKAGLLGELSVFLSESGNEIRLYKSDNTRTLLTSDSLIRSPFFKNSYEVIGKTGFDPGAIKPVLERENIGKLVLRMGIEPERYWDIRNALEKGLSGESTAHLYVFDKEAVICKKIKS